MYEYKVEAVEKVVDGDTVDLRISLGFSMTTIHRCRLLRINAPEMKGESREAGERSKSYLQSLLTLRERDVLVVRTEKDDAFGRYLAELLVQEDDGTVTNINQAMLDAGHAKEYRK
jgi:micrococcal nuclease